MDDGDGEHKLGEAMSAQDDDARDQPGNGAPDCADGDHGDRFGDPEMRRGDPRRIGAAAEESSVAERCDAAISGHQIERQDKQHDRDHARQQGKVVGKQEVPGYGCDQDHSHTKQITLPPAASRWQCSDGHLDTHLALPIRPRGNTQTMAITAR